MRMLVSEIESFRFVQIGKRILRTMGGYKILPELEKKNEAELWRNTRVVKKKCVIKSAFNVVETAIPAIESFIQKANKLF